MSALERLEAQIAALQAEVAALKSGKEIAAAAKASGTIGGEALAPELAGISRDRLMLKAAGVGGLPLSKAAGDADPEWRAFRKMHPRLASLWEQISPTFERLCLEKQALEREARRELEKLSAEHRAFEKATREQLAALEKKFDARLKALGDEPIPPPMLRRAEPAPDAAYDEIASALEKSARAATDERFAQRAPLPGPDPQTRLGGIRYGFVPPPEAFARNR